MDPKTIAFSSLAVALVLLAFLPYLALAGSTNTIATNTTALNETAIQSLIKKLNQIGGPIVHLNTSTTTTTSAHSSSSMPFGTFSGPGTTQAKAFPVVPVTLAVVISAVVAIAAYLLLRK